MNISFSNRLQSLRRWRQVFIFIALCLGIAGAVNAVTIWVLSPQVKLQFNMTADQMGVGAFRYRATPTGGFAESVEYEVLEGRHDYEFLLDTAQIHSMEMRLLNQTGQVQVHTMSLSTVTGLPWFELARMPLVDGEHPGGLVTVRQKISVFEHHPDGLHFQLDDPSNRFEWIVRQKRFLPLMVPPHWFWAAVSLAFLLFLLGQQERSWLRSTLAARLAEFKISRPLVAARLSAFGLIVFLGLWALTPQVTLTFEMTSKLSGTGTYWYQETFGDSHSPSFSFPVESGRHHYELSMGSQELYSLGLRLVNKATEVRVHRMSFCRSTRLFDIEYGCTPFVDAVRPGGKVLSRSAISQFVHDNQGLRLKLDSSANWFKWTVGQKAWWPFSPLWRALLGVVAVALVLLLARSFFMAGALTCWAVLSILWRFAFIDEAMRTKVEAFVLIGKPLALEMAVLALVLLGGQWLIQRGAKKTALFLLGVLLGYSALIRVLDQSYNYYSGNHIDKMVLQHLQGNQLSLEFSSGVLMLGGLTLLGYILLGGLLWRWMRFNTGRPPLFLVEASVAALVVVCAWSIGSTDWELDHSYWRTFRAVNHAGRLLPEWEIPKRYVQVQWPEQFEMKRTIKPLHPTIAKKLQTHFGLITEPNAAYPYHKPQVFDPKLRIQKNNGAAEHPNIILLMLESLSAELTSPYAPEAAGRTPNIQDLAEHSTVFRNYYTSATPTINGLWASMGSYLSTVDRNFWHDRGATTKLKGVGTYLKRAGYKVVHMHHAGDRYMGLGILFERLGFEFWGANQLSERFGKTPKGGWGFSDHQMFGMLKSAVKQLDSVDQPFALSLSTIDTHGPYKLPIDGARRPGDENEVSQVVYSLDDAFGTFWNWFKKSPLSENTIIVLTGDHAMYPGVQHQAIRRRVLRAEEMFDQLPLILYAPGYSLDKSYDRFGSQIDFAPTLLHLLGINGPNSFMGSSLFSESPTGRLGVHSGYFVVHQKLPTGVHEMHRVIDEDSMTRCEGTLPVETPVFSECDYLRWAQWQTGLFHHDRIWP